jgi:hypothetical protein
VGSSSPRARSPRSGSCSSFGCGGSRGRGRARVPPTSLLPESVAARVAAWAPGRREILGAGLAGPRLILVVEDATAYTQRADWIAVLGATRIVRTERLGPLTERRLALPSGLELEVGIAEPSWASVVPVDPETRSVVANGFRILHDPHGLLRSLVSAVGARTSP